MIESLGWGALAASSLVVGALLAMVRTWHPPFIGGVLGFGAGALIASVSYELFEEGLQVGGALAVAIGLGAGALAFYFADRRIEAWSARTGGGSAGAPLALGSLLDGIPEQMVLGIGLASGDGISTALLVAIFVSNLPEGIGSAADMIGAGRSRTSVLRLWAVVAALCTSASVVGWLLADVASYSVQAGINGFAAGALLVMLIDSMIPEAQEKARDKAGLATVVGFALAAGLSFLA